MRAYTICLEISGPTAMWARPDSGDAPVSYPAPPRSAAQGLFESIVWLQTAEVEPTRVQEDLTFVLPSMLEDVFPGPKRSALSPRFRQNVRIERGVLHYAP